MKMFGSEIMEIEFIELKKAYRKDTKDFEKHAKGI